MCYQKEKSIDDYSTAELKRFSTTIKDYIITNDGKVWDPAKQAWCYVTSDGRVRMGGSRYRVSHVMMSLFVGPSEGLPHVAFKDGNPANLVLSNMVWFPIPTYVINERYGRLVINEVFRLNNKTYCVCSCDCGNPRTHAIRLGALRNGNTSSCGCVAAEWSSKLHRTHGLSKHPLYTVLRGMHERCSNPNSKHYHIYGARNISVCEEWSLSNISNFVQWAEANGWSKDCGLQIDRIDNDGNYEPSNCRWVTSKENNRNTRRNVNLTFNGKTQCVADWACELGIQKDTILQRLKRNMSIDRVLSTTLLY